MQKIAEYLDGFEPQLKSVQYCTGGNWEKAIKLNLDTKLELVGGSKLDETTAIEAFFKLSDSRKAFLGLRFTSGLCKAPTPYQFLEAAIQAIYNGKSHGVRGLLGQLGEYLNADTQTYLNQPVQYAELGVTDFWKSTGSLVIRRSHDALLAPSLLEIALEKNPLLLENRNNFTALELAIQQPEAWLGIQVGRRLDNVVYRTDLEAVTTLANMV